ncbi:MULTISPECIES: IspD/TarI family cytidylyltransferase [Mycobacteriaceae]|uniref:IspD/TarI family cytidylyltransferase n=1 Tax=Mycobacteriaceae TaxID=1762 RepID=UPI0004EF78A2|nr:MULTISPECIES: IspD/TarI family cytidylyltransferase [Mycobacteriaceae]AHC26672.2 2-C-methyl-D-erythritol 4-phosphate cytidylyltransferase [Mycolicibacterium neoaurum VKM Ac-1815D]AMO06991.1 2-C-methyl-D-erythritol 4-phosphate cytidylyltransferase [Mycolicibacterium neoaurum]AXK74636.1 2-C-methyl-D-erythritol 4-phosphate cytidylyltransferase [Mycolicibacterium neoaurum]KJQ48340.1 2-C-methyl-D-erythritol 4-phosphate cytidylyltransferase [Mycolicibacterium neoaurum]KUM06625.1 2-C-methyl-D-eryt
MPPTGDPATAVGVVLAAGIGSRVGADGNKAYLALAGRPMLAWSLRAVADTPEIGRVILVYRRGEFDIAEAMVRAELPDRTIELVEGGDTRHESEFNMLCHIAADIESGAVDVVLIHDAARPLAGPEMMRAALDTARRFGGAVPGIDAVGLARAGQDGLHPLTESMVRVQTPQAFRAEPLLAAYRRADAEAFDGTDTSACVQHFTDADVRVFPGAASNLKVTYPPDIRLAEHLLTGRR